MEKYFEEYLQSKAVRNPETARAYRSHVYRINKAPDGLCFADYLQFISFYRAHYAEATTAYASIIFRDFCVFHGREDLARKIKRIRVIRNHWQALTQEEFKKIDDCFDETSFITRQIKLMHRFLWNCGLRVRELARLSIFDITPEEHSTEIRSAKSFKKRTIIWSEDTHRLLLWHLKDRMTLDCKDDSLFVSLHRRPPKDRKAYPITVRTIQRQLKMIGDELGIPLHPHKYRHGFGAKRIQEGAPLPFIQEALGHNNPSSTFTYTRFLKPAFKKEAEKYL